MDTSNFTTRALAYQQKASTVIALADLVAESINLVGEANHIIKLQAQQLEAQAQQLNTTVAPKPEQAGGEQTSIVP